MLPSLSEVATLAPLVGRSVSGSMGVIIPGTRRNFYPLQKSLKQRCKHFSQSSTLSNARVHPFWWNKEGGRRTISTLEKPVIKFESPPAAPLVGMMSAEDIAGFRNFFPEIVKTLTELKEYGDMKETNEWLRKVLLYNVPHGKQNRGLASVLSYRMFSKDSSEIQLAYALGWCIEVLQAYFLVADDIIDQSVTRRGQPCWYKVEDLGVLALNDSLLLESCVYILLEKYFSNKTYYIDLMRLFHVVNHKTIYGQSLDVRTGWHRRIREEFTMDRYMSIVKYKTSYYTFYLPVASAMIATGLTLKNPSILKNVEDALIEIGNLFQIQDDFLDCFGDENVTGKVGTDIEDCKCSWLFVKALELATEEQKDVLCSNYGRPSPKNVGIVKKIYAELDLPEVYSKFEKQAFHIITEKIKNMNADAETKDLFQAMVKNIYGRKK